jgi:hypothetical protein
VILRHDLVKIERVKQLVLRLIVAAHHRKQLRQSARSDYLIYPLHRRVFQQNRPQAVGHNYSIWSYSTTASEASQADTVLCKLV